MIKLRLFFRLPPFDRRLLIEAFALSGIWRAAVLLFPFKKIASFLSWKANGVETQSHDQPALAARIGWAVETAALYTPWRSTCLVQAISAKIMLRRRNIPGTVFLGVASENKNGLRAHAWLQSGDRILTGAEARHDFKQISSFS
jgi:hypothetical protein